MTSWAETLAEAAQYGFMQRAVLAGTFVAVCCSVLGVFLVLRRFALIGDGLGHFSFGAIGLCLALNLQPVLFSIPLVLVASFWLLRLSERAPVGGDAAVGLTSALGVASGVMLANAGGGYNVDLFSYLFGNILVISRTEAGLSVALSLAVTAMVVLFYHDLFATAFEDRAARVLGAPAERINTLLALCAGLTVVLSIRVVGVMLVSSLIIFPAVSALRIAPGFAGALLIAAGFSVVSVWCGIALSYLADLPTGATIVFFNFGCFLLASLAARMKST